MSSNKLELGKKSAFVFVFNIISQFVNFISVIVIARVLKSEVYGQYIYITSFLSFFSIIPNLGLDKGLISFLSRNEFTNREKKSFLSYSILLTTVLGLIVVFITYLANDIIVERLLNKSDNMMLFNILLPTIVLSIISSKLSTSLKAIRKIKAVTFMESAFNPIIKIIILCYIVFVLKNNTYYSLVISNYIVVILSIIYYFYKLYKFDLIGKIQKDCKNFDIVKYSAPLLFTSIGIILSQNVDKYMIGYFIGEESVAIYRIALQFGTISSIALMSVNTIFSPMISNLFYDNKIDELKSMYILTTKWVTVFNMMVFGMIIVFSKDIMRIAGDDFVKGGNVLIIVAIGQVINSIVGSVGNINSMTGKPKYELFSSSVAMISNIILNVLLIPIYGVNGAAVATACSIAIENILNFKLMYNRFKFNPYNKYYFILALITILSSTMIFFISRFININYFIRLIICGIVYMTVFLGLVFKLMISREELNFLKSKFRFL